MYASLSFAIVLNRVLRLWNCQRREHKIYYGWEPVIWHLLIKHFDDVSFPIVGSFSAANGSSQCTLCSKGFYQNKINKTKCEPCAIGSYCRLVFEPLSNTNVVIVMVRLIILLFTLAILCLIDNDFSKEICFQIEMTMCTNSAYLNLILTIFGRNNTASI